MGQKASAVFSITKKCQNSPTMTQAVRTVVICDMVRMVSLIVPKTHTEIRTGIVITVQSRQPYPDMDSMVLLIVPKTEIRRV